VATPRTHGAGRAVLAGLTALVMVACGSPPASPSPSASASPSPPPDPAVGTLRIGVSADPTGFLVPSDDEATWLVDTFIHAALYRLAPDLSPQPDLAAADPVRSAKGLTWTITLARDRHFSDGSTVGAADVVGTYQLALAAACPFGDRCGLARDVIAKVAAPDGAHVVFTLRRPWGPLQAELLAALPILPAAALQASLARLVAATASLDVGSLNDLLGRIEEATNQDECFTSAPPISCLTSTYAGYLETVLAQAGLALPDRDLVLGPDGKPDAERYAETLLERVKTLGRALAAGGTERLAAALPLLDLGARPVGAGPYRLTSYQPGVAVDLVRWAAPQESGTPSRVHLAVIADPSTAATALQGGELDWLPDVSADLAAGLGTATNVRVAARPSDTLRLLTFNVRAGHPYADPVARQAFAACIDRAGDWRAATQGKGQPAEGLLPPGSWAAATSLPWPAYAPAPARAALEAAGWELGSDGVYARGGQRLASTVYVRPGRADLLDFASTAATQLKACGIALDVQALNLSGQALLDQLEYPNTFETFLGTQASGADPDEDLGRLQSRRATTASNPGDADFGGWQDAETDRLLGAGAAAGGADARRQSYLELQVRLAQQVPLLPIAWEPAYAAVATRLQDGNGPVDAGRAGYQRDILAWRLAGS
jgi:ABC-type transport system substrate-binding protein